MPSQNPRFDFESDSTKAHQIAAEGLLYGQEFQFCMSHKKMADGMFLPETAESLDDQVKCCWREHRDKGMATSSSEGVLAVTTPFTRYFRILRIRTYSANISKWRASQFYETSTTKEATNCYIIRKILV